MKRVALLFALGLAALAFAIACSTTSGDDTLYPSSFALDNVALESGDTTVWSWEVDGAASMPIGTEGDNDGGVASGPSPDGSVLVALGATNIQLAVTLHGPPGIWTLSVAADGALSTAPSPAAAPVQRSIQIADTDSGVAASQVFISLYLVETSGPAGIHIVFGQTAQDFKIDEVTAEAPLITFCQSMGSDGACVQLPTAIAASDDGGVDATTTTMAMPDASSDADAGSDADAENGTGAGAATGACLSPAPLSIGTYPAEGDFIYARVQTNPLVVPPWTATVTAQGSLALAGDAGSYVVDDPGTMWVPLVVRAPGLGTITVNLTPGATVQGSLTTGPPRLAIQSTAPVGDGTNYLVTVCTGASTGSLIATSSSGVLAVATVPITASSQCGAGYGGAAILEWSGGKGASVFTLAYAGGSASVTQVVCSPESLAPPPAPVDAGLMLARLYVVSTSSQWPSPVETEAGSEPTFLLVDVTLDGVESQDGGLDAGLDASLSGFPLADQTVAFATSAGLPVSGTFTTDSTGRGFFNVTVPAGITAIDVQFTAGGASTTWSFTEMP